MSRVSKSPHSGAVASGIVDDRQLADTAAAFHKLTRSSHLGLGGRQLH